jgi:hypothetical protein
MGYYIRLLAPRASAPAVSDLESALKRFKGIALKVEAGSATNWEQLVLEHADGTAIAAMERNLVKKGELGEEEIAQFMEELEEGEPASAAEWLKKYLRRVKCIYAFQILAGTNKGKGWGALYAVKDAIKDRTLGITQADGEGFSNEEGFHVLWQFSERVKGKWWMAVLRDGEWVTFPMELGNRKHREAFLRGEVPMGVKLGRPPE